jgi:ribose-phosphate pyrophosphokinase
VLSAPSIDRLKNAPLSEIVITNTLPLSEDAQVLDNVRVLSVGPIIARELKAIFTDASVSSIFLGENQ